MITAPIASMPLDSRRADRPGRLFEKRPAVPSDPSRALPEYARSLLHAAWAALRTWLSRRWIELGWSNEADAGEGGCRIDLGDDVLTLEIARRGLPARFRIRFGHDAWAASDVRIACHFPDGERRAFSFVERGDFYLESNEEIPERGAFLCWLVLGIEGRTRVFCLAFNGLQLASVPDARG